MAARNPGPIAVGEQLLATLTEYRQLHVLLAETDPRHEWVRALELPTELAPEAIAAVEEALDASLSDAVLAMLASHVPHLEDHFGTRLENLGALTTEAWAAGCPRDALAIARGRGCYFCVPRREHPWASTTVGEWRRGGGVAAPRSLARWLSEGPLDELWDMLCDLELIDPGADEPPPQARPEAGAGLVPRLAVAQAQAEAEAPRVEHSKFGVGRVLRETGSGEGRKLEIDFGAGGVRTILARFVRELPRSGDAAG